MEATLISTSRPSEVYSTPSERSVRSLPRRLTIDSTAAPRLRTRSTVRLVSVVVPDCEIATTNVSDMSGRIAKPETFFHVAWLALLAIAARTLADGHPKPGRVRALGVLFVLGWLVSVRTHPVYPRFTLPIDLTLSDRWRDQVPAGTGAQAPSRAAPAPPR